MFGIYLLYLLYLIVRACAELKNMPYYGKTNSGCLSESSALTSNDRSCSFRSDIRIKLSIIFMFIVIGTLVVTGLLRMSMDPFRQSLFENFTKNYRNTIEFCTIFSLFNIYVYTLAFLYSPAKNASAGKWLIDCWRLYHSARTETWRILCRHWLQREPGFHHAQRHRRRRRRLRVCVLTRWHKKCSNFGKAHEK